MHTDYYSNSFCRERNYNEEYLSELQFKLGTI